MKKLLTLVLASLFLAPFAASAQLNLTQGGTGLSTYTTGDILYATSNALRFSKLNIGSNGKCLISNGSAPAWTTCPGGSGSVSTSSAETSGRIPFWTTTGATPALLSGGVSGFTWNNSTGVFGATNGLFTNATTSTFAITGLARPAGAILAVDASGNVIATTTSAGGVASVTGTSNRVTSSGGTNPVIDISASYVGQASLTTVGTLSSGAVPASLVTSGTFGSGNYTFPANLIITGNATATNATTTALAITGLARPAGTVLAVDPNGNVIATTTSTGGVTSVTGTANRITSTGGATPVIDISASYVGQSSITTLGTIATGVWNGTAIANANLANSTISGIALGSNLADLTATNGTLTFSGSYNGGTARNVGLNLTSDNVWTNASTTFVGGVTIGYSTTTQATTTTASFTNASSTKLVSASIFVPEKTVATTISITVNFPSDTQGNNVQQLIRLGTSATTITLSNLKAGGTLRLIVCNPGTTGGAITWAPAGTILWPGGVIPTQTTTADKCDAWSFIATNASSTLKAFGAQTPNF